jgi:hypothetical protein
VKIVGTFPRQVFAALVVASGLAAYPLVRFGSEQIIVASIAGAVLSTVNVLLGYAAIRYAIDKSYTTFLKAVLGGMGIRMVVMLGALVVLIRAFSFHAAALTTSLFGFYVIYLILEIMFIQKTVTYKSTGDRL